MTRSRGGYRGTTDPGSPPAALFRKQIREAGGMTDTPEINRLREEAQREFVRENEWVPLTDAIQAVRNTEARAFREVVEALRDQADMLDPSDCLPPEDHYPTFRGWQGAAQFIERSFLSPDNPEGNA